MIVKHYKGGIYDVLIDGTLTDISLQYVDFVSGHIRAKHTEKDAYVYAYRQRGSGKYYTGEGSFVIYKGKDGEVWARPYEMFWGVTEDGTPRFRVIEGR